MKVKFNIKFETFVTAVNTALNPGLQLDSRFQVNLWNLASKISQGFKHHHVNFWKSHSRYKHLVGLHFHKVHH